MDMMGAAENTTLIESPTNGTCVVVAFSNFLGNALPIWPVIYIPSPLPKPVFFSSICNRLVLTLTRNRTALAISNPIVMFIYGKLLSAYNARFFDRQFPVVIFIPHHVGRFSNALAFLRTICGVSIVFSTCKKVGDSVRVATRGTRKNGTTVLGSVFPTATGIAKMFSPVYPTWGNFFGVATMGTKDSYFSHLASPVMRPDYGGRLVRKPALSVGNYSTQAI